MANEKMKRATLESLMQRAQQRKDESTRYREYESKVLGETLLIKKLPITRICEIMDMAEDDTMLGGLELNVQLIYESVPLLQDKSLQSAFDCVEPHDVVMKLFDDDMGEMERICGTILSMYGIKNMVDDLKN